MFDLLKELQIPPVQSVAIRRYSAEFHVEKLRLAPERFALRSMAFQK
jgi:hypothetical protein